MVRKVVMFSLLHVGNRVSDGYKGIGNTSQVLPENVSRLRKGHIKADIQ